MNDIYKQYGNTLRDLFIEELDLPLDVSNASKEQTIRLLATLDLYMPMMNCFKLLGVEQTQRIVKALTNVYNNAELIAKEFEKK